MCNDVIRCNDPAGNRNSLSFILFLLSFLPSFILSQSLFGGASFLPSFLPSFLLSFLHLKSITVWRGLFLKCKSISWVFAMGMVKCTWITSSFTSCQGNIKSFAIKIQQMLEFSLRDYTQLRLYSTVYFTRPTLNALTIFIYGRSTPSGSSKWHCFKRRGPPSNSEVLLCGVSIILSALFTFMKEKNIRHILQYCSMTAWLTVAYSARK